MLHIYCIRCAFMSLTFNGRLLWYRCLSFGLDMLRPGSLKGTGLLSPLDCVLCGLGDKCFFLHLNRYILLAINILKYTSLTPVKICKLGCFSLIVSTNFYMTDSIVFHLTLFTRLFRNYVLLSLFKRHYTTVCDPIPQPNLDGWA